MTNKILNQLFLSCKKWKTLVLIGVLLTLGFGQTWADRFNGGTMYFYNKGGWTNSSKQLVIGKNKNSYSSVYTMSAVTNTKLWVADLPTSGWNDCEYVAVIGNGSAWGSGSWGTSNLTNAANRTAAWSWSWGSFDSGNTYIITPANGNNDASVSMAYIGSGYSSMNKTITVKAKTSTNNGGSYSDAASGFVTLTAASKKFTTLKNCTTATSLSSGTITCGYTATTTLTAPTTDPSGYKFDGWYNSSGTRQTTSKTLTIYPTEDATYYAYYRKLYTIAASSTVVWDVAGNDKSWSAAYLYKDIEGGSTSNDAMTQCGSTTQYAKTYASAVSNMKVFLFRAQNGSTWSDYKQTTDLYQDLSGITLYTYDNTKTGTKLNWQKTSPAYKAANGQTVYFDNTATQWTQPKFKYGTQWFNRYVDMTQVPGTANLWQYTMPHDIYYGKYKIADEFGWTDYNSIDDDNCAHYTQSQAADITSAKTVIPSTNGAPCTTSILDGYTRSVTITTPSNGTITVTYTDVNNSSKTKTSGSFNVAQTCIITVTATPNTGYVLKSLTVGGAAFTSGNTYIVRAATTIAATFAAETTHNVDVSYICTDTGADVKSGSTTAVGETTASTFEAGTPNGFSFTRWVVGDGLTITAGSTSTNSISVKTKASGTYTLRAEYTEVLTTSWYISGATGGGSPFSGSGTSGTSMSKKTGHSAEEIYYCTISVGTVATGSGFSFNPYNSSESKNYGNASANITKANNSADVYGDNSTALHFLPYVTGNYEFKLDNTGAHPVLTVTWPVYNQLRISAASPTDATNTGNYDLSDQGSNNWAVTRTLNAKTTYTFKMMYDSEWFGNSGNFTRASSSATNIGNTGDMTVKTDAAGDYTFTFNSNSHDFSVTYPAAHKITFGAGNINGSSSAISATASPSFSSGDYVLDATSVTFNKGTTNGGYDWKGWYSNKNGTGTCHSSTDANWTSSSRSADLTVYACYTYQTYTITYKDKGNVAFSGTHASGYPTSHTYNTATTLDSPTKTGYTFGGYYTSSNCSTGLTTTIGATAITSAPTYYAKWTANTYSVKFNRNGGTGGSDMSDQAFTYDVAQNLTTCTYSKTGYTFGGWADSPEHAAAGTVYKTDGQNVSNLSSTQGAVVNLYAIWTPKTTTISFSQSGTGYGSGGQTGTKTATYDAAMPTTISVPTAANGYAFMGYYDVLDPLGTQYYTSSGASARTWNKEDATYTLKAYFKKAEITNIAFGSGTVVENNSTVNVTATISPTPTGTTCVCWRVLYDNGSALDPQPDFTPATAKGTSVSFTAPDASGMYKVEAKLSTGNTCGAGTELDTETADFQVAGSHTVTVAYKYGGTTIKASTSVTGRPLDWSEDAIVAPDIFGYTFSSWSAGDGITIKDSEHEDVKSSTETSIKIKATYNGTLTANYTPKSLIYFKNTLGWSSVYVHFYKSDYWNSDKGSGNNGVPVQNKAMTRIDDTDVWYYDYGSDNFTGYTNSKPTNYVSFTSDAQSSAENFWGSGTGIQVSYPARRADDLADKSGEIGFYEATPMFVPLSGQTAITKNDYNSGKALYYNSGYWTKYLPGTGYTLEIYNSAGNSKLKEFDFTSSDELMPMKAVADLEANTTYKFQIKRYGDVYLGNASTMTYSDHGQNTPWEMTNLYPFKMCGLTTTSYGDYTFNFTYSAYHNESTGKDEYRLRVSVDYPVADGDYRLVYTDNSRSGRIKPSAIVNKVNNGSDIVSFFVRHNQSPVLRIQQATVDGSGNITWKEYPTPGTPKNQITGAIASAIDSTKVYNFNLSMNASGALSVASVEKYKGNFYIRTDAANSKWDNYRTDPDHLMTYSEYLKNDVGYSHYYTHWVNKDDVGRKNVKFVIANDYSPCISDTLARETASGTWANIETFMEEGGDLKRSANVRFMWDIETNAIERAYIDGSQEDGTHFLELLSSDGKIKNTAETETLTAVTFSDNGNWIYEANVKAQPNAQIKLKSTWGEGTTIVQYFKGSSSETETLVGGSGSTWYAIRLLYDFKTNRLVAAYVPSGTINTNIPINADVMFIREHQEDISQLTFSGTGSAISKIETAYGVLRFNKWTINNKSKTGTHTPLSTELSRFERDMFYVSFPFRVNLEEVFGFGTYGTHWIVEEYDGAGRAANGFWADTPTFWRFITNRKGKFLEPNKGYIVALDLDELGESSSVWANTENVELYFPSYGSMPDIKSSSVTYEIPEHTCNIGPRFAGGDDRRIKDSHWNVMSVPTYINTDDVTFANNTWITAGDGQLGPKFLYTWNKNDNTLSATSGTGYTYHAMHAYIVQYCGNVTWTTSVSPAGIVARRTYAEAPKDVEFRLELSQNDNAVDQTFVRMSNDEAVTSGFEFNYDLSKEFNKNKANIYTMVSTMIDGDLSITETAGNCLPTSNQTTVVPVGVQIATAGDYTFAMPDGTSGVGVTLIDNETGIRTSLSALSYMVTLEAGTYDNRFVLEISPVMDAPTDMEGANSSNDNIRKVLIDGLMYIVKDGVMYDARGARVK